MGEHTDIRYDALLDQEEAALYTNGGPITQVLIKRGGGCVGDVRERDAGHADSRYGRSRYLLKETFVGT